MGYRSDVALVLSGEANLDFIANRSKAAQYIPDSFLEKPFVTGEESVVYLAEYIEWCDNHPLFKLIQDFIADLEEEDYFYIVVGEDTGDLTEEGNTDLQVYWELFTQWGLDIGGLKNQTLPPEKLANADPAHVHPPMFMVELMLCWEDYRWSDGEYVYISTLIEPSEVENLAIKTYNANLIYTASGDKDRPLNVAVYNWNPAETYQIIEGDLVEVVNLQMS